MAASPKRASIPVQTRTPSGGHDSTAALTADLLRLARADKSADLILETACKRAQELLGADLAALILRAAGGGFSWLAVSGSHSGGFRDRPQGHGKGPAAVCVSEGRTVVARRGQPDGMMDGLLTFTAEGLETALAVPLRSAAGIFGSLVFGWRSDAHVTPEQQESAEAIADYVACVVDNTLAHHESERRRNEAEALAELMRQGAAEHDPQRVIDLVSEQAAKLAGADYAGVRLLDDDSNLVWSGMWGNRSNAWRSRRVSSGTGNTTEAFSSGRTVVDRIDDVVADGVVLEPTSVRASEGTKVQITSPLSYGGRSIGALVIGYRSDVWPTPEQLRAAELVGSYAAAVVDNARWYAESERRRMEAEALAELVRQGAAERDPDRAITLVCDRARQLLGADYAGLVMVGQDERRMWHGSAGNRSPSFRRPTRGRGSGPTALALKAGKALALHNLQESPDSSQFHAAEGGSSAIAAPYFGRDGLKGALHLGWRGARPISAAQLHLAEALASYAAVILENARAHASLEERAEELAASEEELRSLSEELELRVEERTSELKAANEELEAFSYSVSHDLQAPLRSINGFTQMIEETDGASLSEEAQGYLHRVQAASRRMGELIDDLLSLARVTRTPMTRKRVDLSAIARLVVDTLKERSPERDVSVEIQPGLTAYGDAPLLQVALENLLGNAWKFTANHPSAHIAFGAAGEGRDRSYFVRDDGAGFDLAYNDKLFKPFQRLHGMTEFEGTGIGLATVERIVHRHGGRVWADAKVEGGATFYFTLEPVASGSTPPTTPAAAR